MKTEFLRWLLQEPRIIKDRSGKYDVFTHPVLHELCFPETRATQKEAVTVRQAKVHEYLVHGKIDSILTLINRPYRPDALWYLWSEIPTESLKEAIFSYVWSDTESPDEPVWHRLWNRVTTPVLDSSAAREWYGALSNHDTVTVYRGGRSQNRSWSLSRSTAGFFAKRFGGNESTVKSREIKKADIHGVFFDRQEREIVLAIQG